MNLITLGAIIFTLLHFTSAAYYQGVIVRPDKRKSLNNIRNQRSKQIRFPKLADTTTSTTTTTPKSTTSGWTPTFGEWLGGFAGQLPMNFSDVQPEFIIKDGDIQDTRKYGKPDYYQSPIGILTPQEEYSNKPLTYQVSYREKYVQSQNYQNGPEQPYANVLPSPQPYDGGVKESRNFQPLYGNNYNQVREPQPVYYPKGIERYPFNSNVGGQGNYPGRHAEPFSNNYRPPIGSPNQDFRALNGPPLGNQDYRGINGPQNFASRPYEQSRPFGPYKPSGFQINEPQERPEPQYPNHSLEQFGDLTDYLPGPDFEDFKAGAKEPPSPLRDEGQYDTYFNEEHLPPTASDSYKENPEIPEDPFLSPPRPSFYDPGPGRDRPEGQGQGSYPGSPEGPYSGGAEGYPGGEGEYPGDADGEGEYPETSGPEEGCPGGEEGQYPREEGQNPDHEGQYPAGEGQYPGGEGQYPSGEGHYPEGPYPGESGPRGPRREPRPIDYRSLPLNHPLKWNDDGFFFDHDFNPTQGQPVGVSREKPGSFFEDFGGFYSPESHDDDYGTEGRSAQGKDFGASDGFPNFFNEGQKRPRQANNDLDGFENFNEGQQQGKPFRPSEPYPGPPPGTFRHHRAGLIPLQNRRVLQLLQQARKKPIARPLTRQIII